MKRINKLQREYLEFLIHMTPTESGRFVLADRYKKFIERVLEHGIYDDSTESHDRFNLNELRSPTSNKDWLAKFKEFKNGNEIKKVK